MRDALVAGITLNIFNKNCDRVKMACIAQMVNVLQSVILTEGPRMLLTPTYHIFHMYKHHQGAELAESFVEGNQTAGAEAQCRVPQISESVSVSADGTVNITLNNLSVSEEAPIEMFLTEMEPSRIEAVVLTGKMNAYNTFEEPENIKEEIFTDYKAEGRKISLTMPACSVIAFRIK